MNILTSQHPVSWLTTKALPKHLGMLRITFSARQNKDFHGLQGRTCLAGHHPIMPATASTVPPAPLRGFAVDPAPPLHFAAETTKRVLLVLLPDGSIQCWSPSSTALMPSLAPSSWLRARTAKTDFVNGLLSRKPVAGHQTEDLTSPTP